jgi:hypothetical protein
VLSESDAWAMEVWIRSAKRWSEASQAMVIAGTELTNASRTLAAQLDGRAVARAHLRDRADLQAQLRMLAGTIEDEGRELRDRHLATQAKLGVYTDLLA